MESNGAPAEHLQPHAGGSGHGAERRARPTLKAAARIVLTEVRRLCAGTLTIAPPSG